MSEDEKDDKQFPILGFPEIDTESLDDILDDNETRINENEKCIESKITDSKESKDNKYNKEKKNFVRRGVDWFKNRNYKDFFTFNGKLLLAEAMGAGVGVLAGEGAAEYLGNSETLNTLGTYGGYTGAYWGTYIFTEYLHKKKLPKIGRFSAAYLTSGIFSTALRIGLTYYFNVSGYTAGESALMGNVFPIIPFVISMNILGYKLGLIEDKKSHTDS